MINLLSNREIEVLKLLVLGLKNKEIAEEMKISIKTVENHLRIIYAKLGVSGRTSAVAATFTKGFDLTH